MQHITRKIMMTLVLLMTAAAGAWAQTGENIFQYCYDCQRSPAYPMAATSATLSSFANPLVGYNGTGFSVNNTSDGPWKLEYMGLWSTTNNYGIDDVSFYQSIYNCTDVPVFRLYQWNATANEYQHAAYGVVCCYAKVSNAVEHTALFVSEEGWGCVLTNSSHSTSMNIIFDEDLTTGLTTIIAGATPGITFTRGTGEHSNEWTMDGGMPAGNVLLTVAYKDRTATTATCGGEAIPTGGVTGYVGFEAAFAEQIKATVQNMEPTYNPTPGDPTPVNDATFTYTSNDATVIAFGSTDAASGALEDIKFLKAGSATLTVEYTGTADLATSKVDLSVTVAEPATLTLASNDVTLGTVEAVMPSLVEALQLDVPNEWADVHTKLTADDMPGFKGVTLEQAKTWTGAPTDKVTWLAYRFDDDNDLYAAIFENGKFDDDDYQYERYNVYNLKDQGKPFYYTTGYTPSNVIDNGDGTYKVIPGTEVTLNVTPTDGNELKGWSAEGLTDKGNGFWTVTVNESMTLTATFDEPSFAVKMADPTHDEAGNWTIKSGDMVATGNANAGLTGLKKDDPVTLTYNGRMKVKSVTATTDAVPAAGKTVDLSTLEGDYEAKDGDVLTGKLAANVKVSIAAGATVTLDGVTINGVNNDNYMWAGLNCLGDATIILKDGTTNTVNGFYEDYPGIHVPSGSTLTIQGGTQGTGTLTASSTGWGAGIGGGYQIPCGHITITGGTVTATGGFKAAGIGSGDHGDCGNITIASTVKKVTATKGTDAPYSIGKGYGDNASCGTITIGGTVYWQDNAAVGDGATYLAQGTIIYPPSN